MKPHRPYTLEEYNPEWKNKFEAAAKRLKPIFGDNLLGIEHIGSTSIPGMLAKPQIDILAIVKNLDEVTDKHAAFKAAGFTPKGRGYVNDYDEYLVEDSPDGHRAISVHTIPVGHPQISEYRNLRDYLIANKEDRELYASIKKDLYAVHRDSFAEYDHGKDKVIKEIIDRATQWRMKSS